jgi:hypothetical protein
VAAAATPWPPANGLALLILWIEKAFVGALGKWNYNWERRYPKTFSGSKLYFPIICYPLVLRIRQH